METPLPIVASDVLHEQTLMSNGEAQRFVVSFGMKQELKRKAKKSILKCKHFGMQVKMFSFVQD